ncbi:hypothetical protein HK104_001512 [Borealophlyctis nickersoniae]|nr:hypothetical protein HK104_001512 [Borealophlyctis nickersoniae]
MSQPDLKKTFRYADPVIVALETINFLINDRANDALKAIYQKRWWKVLATTRVLLAHLVLNNDTTTHNMILGNLRNLLRLVGVHLEDKAMFEDVTTDTAYYNDPDEKGVVWVSMKKGAQAVKPMHQPTFEELKADFNDDHGDLVTFKRVFGHCVYKTVSIRETLWKKWGKEFSELAIGI